MRLINVKTMEMEHHMDPPKKYAILSHTWGHEEVSLADYLGSSSLKDLLGPDSGKEILRGYQKIKYTCKQAIINNLPFVWIDTCCIDKTSSAELSEAINSMYQWYKLASVCYAYLEDVSTMADSGESFRHSRWFTRGWTLQELLAPKEIKFYGLGWTPLGSKATLGPSISEATRIFPTVLQSPILLPTVSCAIKLSWAASRSTTREEDRAYSLMGIFGVNMPLLYGEGGQKAFFRLQQEILRFIDDDTLFVLDRRSTRNQPFAETLDQFRDSSDVVRAGFDRELFGTNVSEPNHAPFSLTSKGIKMKVPIIQWNEHNAIVLQCCRMSDPSSYIVLPIMQPSSDSQSWKVLSGDDRLPSTTRPTVSRAEWKKIYLVFDSDRQSRNFISWVSLRIFHSNPSEPQSFITICPLLNLSFTKFKRSDPPKPTVDHFMGSTTDLLPQQNKATYEFVGTITTYDIAFIIIIEGLINTPNWNVRAIPKTCQSSIDVWIEAYRQSPRDLYNSDSNKEESSISIMEAYFLLLTTMCFWVESEQCILVISAFGTKSDHFGSWLKIDTKRIYRTSRHFDSLFEKIGQPSFAIDNKRGIKWSLSSDELLSRLLDD